MKIKQDGVIKLERLFSRIGRASKIAIYTSGDGIAILKHKDDSGNYIDMVNGDMTPPVQKQVNCGLQSNLYLDVAGVSDLTPLNLVIKEVK